MSLDFEEADPFFVEKGEEVSSEKLAEEIVSATQQCEQNWENHVKNTLERNEVTEVFHELNFERKDEISLRAFVREVGFHLEHHYRNRDLFRIYERLRPCDEKSFRQIMQKP